MSTEHLQAEDTQLVAAPTRRTGVSSVKSTNTCGTDNELVDLHRTIERGVAQVLRRVAFLAGAHRGDGAASITSGRSRLPVRRLRHARVMDTNEDERLATIAHEIASSLEREGNVKTVFGGPMKLDTRTVIPVAVVAMGGGGGGVGALGAAVNTVRRWLTHNPVQVSPSRTFVGGGGGGLDVRPVGFLSEEDGRIVFTPILIASRGHRTEDRGGS